MISLKEYEAHLVLYTFYPYIFIGTNISVDF